MNKKHMDEILNKYMAGESTLKEEKELLKVDHADPEIADWSMFAKAKRINTPDGLQDEILTRIQARTKRRRWLYASTGIAATIVLILAVMFEPQERGLMSENEKQVLLSEVLSMFPEAETVDSKKEILYEDELIVIYIVSDQDKSGTKSP
ncbi:MAG: hypothetical protein RIC06_14785 [Cyclobacteriaceae bacterium]